MARLRRGWLGILFGRRRSLGVSTGCRFRASWPDRSARFGPFFAINGNFRQELDFSGGLSVQTGWSWCSTGGQLLRTGVHFYNGPSTQSRFSTNTSGSSVSACGTTSNRVGANPSRVPRFGTGRCRPTLRTNYRPKKLRVSEAAQRKTMWSGPFYRTRTRRVRDNIKRPSTFS